MALRQGPLAGIKVVEFVGIGPGPLCGMLLADMGAEVLMLERLEPADVGLRRPRRFEPMHRGKQSVAVDLKHAQGVAFALDLCARADVAIEGFRPGTMERLGLGPGECMARNDRLVYARMTGYGQTGPMSQVAGHDLNYIALTGALHAIGRADAKPTPPLNVVGDYAGGSMTLAFGIVCALLERAASGKGQVIDASMVEGAALLMTPLFGLHAAGMHAAPRGRNLLDSGAPFYDVYECADGEFVAFAAIEHKFRAVFAERAGLSRELLEGLDDPASWQEGKALLTGVFKSRSQREWCDLLEQSDACITPVLRSRAVGEHAHNRARGSFIDPQGILQPAPAPRFSRTPGQVSAPPPDPSQGGEAVAAAWGVDRVRLDQLRRAGAIGS
ncbi:CaiB/BaiF CoA-transferase family protein [soil metagenome]